MPTKWRSGNKDVGRDKTRPLFVYEENKIWQRWFLFHIFWFYFLRFSGSFGKLNESIRLNVPVFRFIKAKANNIEHVLLPDHCSSDYSFTVFTPEPKFACLNRTFAVCGISRISYQKQFLFSQWLHLFIKETVTFGRVKINCVKLWVSIFFTTIMDTKHVIHMQWVLGKSYLTLSFLFTEYGLQGSDFRAVDLSQLNSHEQNGN